VTLALEALSPGRIGLATPSVTAKQRMIRYAISEKHANVDPQEVHRDAAQAP
jgi:hypothetical protein